MDELLIRFPHLGDQIFTKLRKSGTLDYQEVKQGKLEPQDVKSGLIECREVSRLWKNFIGLFRLLVVHSSMYLAVLALAISMDTMGSLEPMDFQTGVLNLMNFSKFYFQLDLKLLFFYRYLFKYSMQNSLEPID